jgi:hypothetical protein
VIAGDGTAARLAAVGEEFENRAQARMTKRRAGSSRKKYFAPRFHQRDDVDIGTLLSFSERSEKIARQRSLVGADQLRRLTHDTRMP